MAISSANVSVETVTELRTVNGAFPNETCIGIIAGQATKFDGLGGIYFFSTSSTATDDGFLVVKPDSISNPANPGRWLRTALLQADYTQATGTSPEYVKNKPTLFSFAPTISSVAAGARNFNQAYQISTTRYAEAKMSAQAACTLNLTTGTSAEIFMEWSADGSTGWTLAGKLAGANTGSLTIGLNSTQISGGQLNTMLQPGYYWRMRTNNVTGTPTYTFNGGQEVLY